MGQEIKMSTEEKTEELVIPTEYLEMDPKELATNEEGIQKIIQYLKDTRENIRAAEKAGKRITSKAARTKPPQFKTNPLDMLLKEV